MLRAVGAGSGSNEEYDDGPYVPSRSCFVTCRTYDLDLNEERTERTSVMQIQGWHILIIIVIAILLFGAPKLPGLARSVGQSLRIFKSEVRQMKDENGPNDTDGSSPVEGRVVDQARYDEPNRNHGSQHGPTRSPGPGNSSSTT